MSDEVRAPSWSLYIDESGTFDAGQPSIVLGVALRHASVAEFSAALQRTMSALVPEMRWPLHATELRRPLGLLAAWMRLAPALREPASNRSVAFDALVKMSARVQCSHEPEVVAFREAVRSGRRISQGVFAAAEAWAAHLAHHDMERLRLRSEQIFDHLRYFHRLIGQRLAPADFFLVAALSPRETSHDRYLATLEAMIERAAWVLRSEHEERAIELVVASRRVRVDGAQTVSSRAIVDECVQRARRSTLGAIASDSVSVRTVTVVDYREDALAPMVIADLASNQLRRLFSCDLSRQRLADAARREVGVEPGVWVARGETAFEFGLAPPDPWRESLAQHAATGRRRATPPKPTWAQEQLREDVSRVDAWRGGRR